MYLYRGTGDPYMLEIGEDILHSIQYNARTECGYATIRDVTTLTLEDRMESFFLAETVKYLYLLFDPNNFIHSEGDDVTVVETPRGKCTVYAGGYIFNTEAHPIDPSALNCCTGVGEDELHKEIEIIDELRSSRVLSGLKKSKKQIQDRLNRRKKKNASSVKAAAQETVYDEDDRPTSISPQIVVQLDSKGSKFSTDDTFISDTINILERQAGISIGKSEYLNPLLSFKKKFTPNPFLENSAINLGSTLTSSSLPLMQTVTSQSENLVFKLLKKLFEDTPDYKEQVRKDFAGGVLKGLMYNAKEDKEVAKLIQKFETNLKVTEEAESVLKAQRQSLTEKQGNNKNLEILSPKSGSTGTATVIKTQKKKAENRIRAQSPYGDEDNPDLDLIFGTSPTSRSLSFYFSLKWLPAFPSQLLRHLLPSEGFDIQNFYSRINEMSSDGWAKKYNISDAWVDNFGVLRCPSLKLADRFMFFRSSVED